MLRLLPWYHQTRKRCLNCSRYTNVLNCSIAAQASSIINGWWPWSSNHQISVRYHIHWAMTTYTRFGASSPGESSPVLARRPRPINCCFCYKTYLFFDLFEDYNQANLGFPIGLIGPTHSFDFNNECEIYIPVAL